MYKISKEQMGALLQAFYDLNAPVKMFDGVKKLLGELELIDEPAKVAELPAETETKSDEENSN